MFRSPNMRFNRPQNSRGFFTFVDQFERGVTLTMGKLTSVKEPGLRLLIPIFQTMYKIDMRTRVLELPPLDLFTKDNVSSKVNAIAYFRVVNPELAVMEVADLDSAVHQLIQGQLRDTLCSKDFSDILVNRETVSKEILGNVSAFAKRWGAEVERVQLKNLDIADQNMVRAMAKEAEATRDKIAAIIRAQGELDAAKLLVDAATIMSRNVGSLELRRLQTLEKISKERSQHTVIVPMDFTANTTGAVLGMSPRMQQETNEGEVETKVGNSKNQTAHHSLKK